MKPILILGAAGFVGRHLVQELLSKGFPVRAMVRDPQRAKGLLGELASRIELVEGDIIAPESLQRASEGCQAVYHLVAIELERGAHTFESVHVEGTQHALKAAQKAGIERFLYLGQISPGESAPDIRFTYTKWQGEELVRKSGLCFTVFRAGIIIGPGDHFVREMKRLASWPLVPLAGSGETLLQPVSVWDVATGLASSLQREDTFSKTLEIAGEEQLTYKELAQKTLLALGKKRALVRIPKAVLYFPAWVAARTMKRPPLTPELLRLLSMPNIAQQNALPGLLPSGPMSLEEALARTQKELEQT